MAEYWLEHVKRSARQLEFTDAEKLSGVQGLLKEEAQLWWDNVTRGRPAAEITWEFFLDRFEKKFIGQRYKDEQRRAFIYLRQRQLSVFEYERQFSRLEKYAPEMVDTEERWCRKFEEGLNRDLRMLIVNHRYQVYTDLVEAALNIEQLRNEEKQVKAKKSGGPRGSQGHGGEALVKRARSMPENQHFQSQSRGY